MIYWPLSSDPWLYLYNYQMISTDLIIYYNTKCVTISIILLLTLNL